MAVANDPLQELLKHAPPASATALAYAPALVDPTAPTFRLGQTGRQPSFNRLSRRGLVAKGGIPVEHFDGIDLMDPAADAPPAAPDRAPAAAAACPSSDSLPLPGGGLKMQSSYYRFTRHAQSAKFAIIPPLDGARQTIAPIAAGKTAWMRSLHDLNAARWRELGYDPADGTSKPDAAVDPVWSGLPVILDHVSGAEDDESELSPRLSELAGRCASPQLVAALRGRSVSGGDDVDVFRLIVELQRLAKQCEHGGLTHDFRHVRHVIDRVREEYKLAVSTNAATMSTRPLADASEEESAQIDAEERDAIREAEARQQERLPLLQQEWCDERKRRQFAQPSPALLAMRRTAQRMIADDRSMIQRQIAAKEAEEAQAATERMAEGYEAALNVLKAQFEAEIAAIRNEFDEKRAALKRQGGQTKPVVRANAMRPPDPKRLWKMGREALILRPGAVVGKTGV